MKWILIVLAFAGLGTKSLTQDRLSLKLELVKPTGKIDSTSCFQCTLTNQSDTAVVIHAGEVGTGMPVSSFFRYEYEHTDGSKQTGGPSNGFVFFDEQHGRVPVSLLRPGESVKTKIPIFFTVFDFCSGVLPYNEEMIRSVKRVRVRLEKFEYMNQVTVEFVENKTLLSNWVEVDADAVIALLRKRLKK